MGIFRKMFVRGVADRERSRTGKESAMTVRLEQVRGETHVTKAPQNQPNEVKGAAKERKNALRPLPPYPSLYQINTRVWLTDLSRTLGRTATLDDIPDAELDRFAEMGFDWIWFLSVWQTGPTAQQLSRSNPEWRHEFQETLPDLREADIGGSGFAIAGYTVHTQLGGDAALARL